MNVLYKSRGGGWYGFMLQGSWPFAKLEINDEHLVFSLAGAKKILRRDEIKYLKRIFILPFVADGVVIVPRDKEPRVLIFWALNPGKILSILKAKNINTQALHDKDVLPFIFFAYSYLVVFLLIIFAMFWIN